MPTFVQCHREFFLPRERRIYLDDPLFRVEAALSVAFKKESVTPRGQPITYRLRVRTSHKQPLCPSSSLSPALSSPRVTSYPLCGRRRPEQRFRTPTPGGGLADMTPSRALALLDQNGQGISS
jgi:hypothetical protein